MYRLKLSEVAKISIVMITTFLLLAPTIVEAAFQDQSAALGLPTDPLDLGNDYPFKASWGDYDNDGWTDLYVSKSLLFGGLVLRNDGETGGVHNGFSNLFFLNDPSPTATGGIWGDYNNDGFLDMFCSGQNPGEWSLWRNSFGSFANPSVGLISDESPWLTRANGVASCWVDFDNDGDLDIYTGGFEVDLATPLNDYWLTNNGNGNPFTETAQPSTGHSRGITACDYDEDGDMDIYVSVYRQLPNILWQNDGVGGFTDVAATAEVAGSPTPVSPALNSYGHSIGSAWGDMDNDGDFDLVVANLNHHDTRWSDDSKFYSNDGDGTFTDVSSTVGLVWQESFACPALADYDNDGDLDILMTSVGDSPQGPVLYRNDGSWSFTDVTVAEGLGSIPGSYQAAWADFDNDGDVDLITDCKLFVNNLSNSNHWLKVKLQSNTESINSVAIGAQVRITLPGNYIITRQVEGGTGQGNQNDLTLHLGLGSNSGPVDVEVFWPGGTVQVESNVAVDQLITISTPGCPEGDTDDDCDVDLDDLGNVAFDWLVVGPL